MSSYNPNDYDNGSATLQIASSTIPSHRVLAEFLCSIGISATVVESTTVMRNTKKLWLEPGCNITIHGLKTELLEQKLWNPLKKEYNLQCGFLDIPGRYKGCIVNFIRPSLCSCNQKRTNDSKERDTSRI